MTILKNKYTQLILVGFIFALISGSFGFLAHKKFINISKQEKIIVIIEVETNSPFLAEILKLTSNQKISEQIKKINKELFQSINYSLIRYQRDSKLSAGCFNIKRDLTDNSIFIETKIFSSEKKKAMDECLNTLFDLSLQRLKNKLIVNINDEILRANFKINQFKKYRDYEKSKTKNVFPVGRKLKEQLCKEFQPIFSSIINSKQYKADKKKAEINPDNFLNDLVSMPKIFENLSELIYLERECSKIQLKGATANEISDFAEEVRDEKFESLFNTKEGLKSVNSILSDIDFQSVFKIEKLDAFIESEDAYLTEKQLIISFTLLGFLFGSILVYHFRFNK